MSPWYLALTREQGWDIDISVALADDKPKSYRLIPLAPYGELAQSTGSI
jgi:hypothetical protein